MDELAKFPTCGDPMEGGEKDMWETKVKLFN